MQIEANLKILTKPKSALSSRRIAGKFEFLPAKHHGLGYLANLQIECNFLGCSTQSCQALVSLSRGTWVIWFLDSLVEIVETTGEGVPHGKPCGFSTSRAIGNFEFSLCAKKKERRKEKPSKRKYAFQVNDVIETGILQGIIEDDKQYGY